MRGHLYGVGGPAPGAARPWAGVVTVSGAGLHRDIQVGRDGAYSIALPAGSYTLAGHSPLYQSGAGVCRAAAVVKVSSGRVVAADVLCQMS